MSLDSLDSGFVVFYQLKVLGRHDDGRRKYSTSERRALRTFRV